METAFNHCGQIGVSSKHLARRLLTIGENRLGAGLISTLWSADRAPDGAPKNK